MKGKEKGRPSGTIFSIPQVSDLSILVLLVQLIGSYMNGYLRKKKPPKNNKTNNKNNLVLQHEVAHALNKLCPLFSDCASDDLYSDSEEDEASNFDPVRWGFLFNMSCQLHVSLVLCGALHTLLPVSSRGVLRDEFSEYRDQARALWPLPRKFQLLNGLEAINEFSD